MSINLVIIINYYIHYLYSKVIVIMIIDFSVWGFIMGVKLE